MKNIMLVIFMACAAFFLGGQSVEASAAVNPDGSVAINETNFPEQEFRDRVAETVDKNKDGILSQEEINAVTSMSILCPDGSANWNITGIEFFCNLQKVEMIEINQKPGLIIGSFRNNKKLTEVYICISTYKFSENELSQLLPMDQLVKLEFEMSFLPEKSLIQAKHLKTLIIGYSEFKNLDFSGMTNLESAKLSGQYGSKKMDLSANKKLKTLDINSDISGLILPSKGALENVTIYNKMIKSLNLTGCEKLKKLSLYCLPLNKLDLSSNKKLKYLTIQNVPIEKLNLTKNKALKEVALHSGTLENADLERYESDIVPSNVIPWFTESTYSTKITLPKKNNITKFTCFTKDKQIDLSRCHKIKKINVSDHGWVKLSKKWFYKNKRKVTFYSNGDKASSLKVKKIKKYVKVKARPYL